MTAQIVDELDLAIARGQRAFEAGEPFAVHYIGFRGDEFARARRLFGGPVMIHRKWDRRARRDIGPDDIVIFATGDETQPVSETNGDDIDERWLLPRQNEGE